LQYRDTPLFGFAAYYATATDIRLPQIRYLRFEAQSRAFYDDYYLRCHAERRRVTPPIAAIRLHACCQILLPLNLLPPVCRYASAVCH